jgi:hypothetical protein
MYARALAEIPLPVRSFEGIDPSALQVLAEADIGDRRIRFGVLATTPRLWIAFTDELPPVLGYITGLINPGPGAGPGAPQLHITERDHLEWARHTGRVRQIKSTALAAWNAAQRECEG